MEPDVDAALAAASERTPVAARALMLLLAATESVAVEAALVAESATYSALQAGPEHLQWLDQRDPARRRDEPPDPVQIERTGDRLTLTLNRPHVRNAFSAAMRDSLLDALEIAHRDPSVTDVVLEGAGPTFCSGGDLDEFGTRPDPATAHLIRVDRSAGRSIHQLRDRVTVSVHGSCVGAGVELPAFAGRVVAAPDTTFRLPEVGMGLVPGAGGTVSIPRRIGVPRAAWLALTGTAIDAATALDWGLIDDIEARSNG